MKENLHDCVCLTASEFLLLSSAAGIGQIGSLFRKRVEELSDENLHESLALLYASGLLRVDETEKESCFRTDSAVTSIFQAIKEADTTAVFFRKDSDTPDLLGYVADSTVIVQVSDAEVNAVRLFCMPFSEAFSWLQDEGYLPGKADPRLFRRELEQAAQGQSVEVRFIDTDRYLCTGLK